MPTYLFADCYQRLLHMKLPTYFHRMRADVVSWVLQMEDRNAMSDRFENCLKVLRTYTLVTQ